jgi:Ni,Fe-hydrogenase I small subunit
VNLADVVALVTWAPLLAVTMYCVMGTPPLNEGATQLTVAEDALVADADTCCACWGVVAAVMRYDTNDGEEYALFEFTATTVKV